MIGIGALLVTVSSVLLLIGYRIPYIFFTYELAGDTYELDFTIFIYFTAMIAGLASITVALKLSRLPENVIVSFPISRFIAGLLLLALGVTAYFFFGVEFGEMGSAGSWLFLGGFSLFFPTGMLPMIYGIYLLAFSAFTFMKLKVTKTEKSLVFDEMRFPRAMSTEIPLDEIEAIRLTNAKTGIKFLWILPFIVPIVYLYIDAFSFLLNDPFGSGELVGYAYFISASVQLICMLLLVVNTQHVIDIVTKDKLYELHFCPINWKSLQNSNIGFIIQIPAKRPDLGEQLPPIVQAGDLKRVACGVLFLVLGIAGRAAYFWAGELLRFVLIISGIILVVDGMKNDLKFINKKLDVLSLDGGKSYKLSGNGIVFKTEYYFSNVRQLVETDKQNFENANTVVQLRKLTSIDHVIVAGILFFMGLQGFPVLAFLPTEMKDFIGARAAVVILVVAAIALSVWLAPANVFKVKFGDRNFQVPVQMRDGPLRFFLVQWVINFCKKYVIIWRTQRKQLLLRLLELGIAAALGIATSAIVFYA